MLLQVHLGFFDIPFDLISYTQPFYSYRSGGKCQSRLIG